MEIGPGSFHPPIDAYFYNPICFYNTFKNEFQSFS